MKVKKYGRRRGLQRYKCNECGHFFQSSRRANGIADKLWKEYVEGKQSLVQLTEKYKRSHVWIRNKLDTIVVHAKEIKPQAIVAVVDTTFWSRHYGVCVFRSAELHTNLWWKEVESECMTHYTEGRAFLEEKGWKLLAAVVDGRKGFLGVFSDIPVQMCHFHQVKIVTRYITRRPNTDAGKELKTLIHTLTKTSEVVFNAGLSTWHTKWELFINEKTTYISAKGKTRWRYTHSKLRSAYGSIKKNLPHLFTYLKYPELKIPNTTNPLDGSFSALKNKLAVHHGLREDRRYRLISKLLRDGA